jgi:1,4-dihydroxy-2-naphthoyl-CoA hydrolase
MRDLPDFPDLPDLPGSYDKLLGLRYEEATGDGVVAVLPVTPDLYQSHGIVHGGVYATAVETTASVGASLWLGADGRAVGISNYTDFLRPVRQGELHIQATPINRGRSTQLWQVAITDERGRPVAHGRVRLMNLNATPGLD